MTDQIPQENYDSGAQTPFNFQDAVLGDFFQYSYPPVIPFTGQPAGQGNLNPPEIVNLPPLQEQQSYFYNTIDLISPYVNQTLNQRGKNYSNVNYISSNDISILGTGVSFTQDAINALSYAGGSLPGQGGRADGLTVGQYFSPWSGKLYWSNNLDSVFDKAWKGSKDEKIKYYMLKYLLEKNKWDFGVTLGTNAPLNIPPNFYRRPLKVSEIWTAGATYAYTPTEYSRWRNMRNYKFVEFQPTNPWTGQPQEWRYGNGQIMPGQTWGEEFAEQRQVGETAPKVTLPNGDEFDSIKPEEQLRGEARYELVEYDVGKFPYDAGEIPYAAAYTKYKIDNGITRGAQNYLEYATEIGNENEWFYYDTGDFSGLTYIKNYALAPDGTNTATLLIFPKTASSKYSFVRSFDSNLPGNDNNLTFSVWIKKPTEIIEYPGATASDRVGLRLSWGGYFPDETTSSSLHGIIGFTASGIGITLTNNQSGFYIGGGETYLNDWYRVWIKPTFAPVLGKPFTASIAIPNPTTGEEFWQNTGNTLGLLVWGAQVEDGTGPSDFITTNKNRAFNVTSTFNPQNGRTDQVDLDNFKAYYANMLGHATGEIYPTPEEKFARRWVPLARTGIKLPAGWSGPPGENSYPPADDQMFVAQGGRGLYGLYLGSAWTMRALVHILDALEGKDIVDQNLFNKTKDLIRYELQRIAFTMANSYRARYGWNVTYGEWNPLYWWPVDSKAGWVSNQLIEPMTGLLIGVMYLNKDMKNPGFLSRKLYDLGIEFFRINMDLFGPGIEWHEGIAYFGQSSWIFNELGKIEKLNGDQRLKTHLSGQNYLGPLWRWAFHMRLPGKRYVNYGDGVSNIEGYYANPTVDWGNVLNSVIAEGSTLGYEVYKYFHPVLGDGIGGEVYGYSKLKWAQIYGQIPQINTPPSGLTLYEYFPNIRVVVWRDKWERVHVEDNPTTFAVWIKGEGLEDAHIHRDAGTFSVYDGNRIIFGECGTERPYPSPDNIMAHQANGHNMFRLLDRFRGRTVDCPITVKYLDKVGGGVTLNTTAAYYQGGEYGAQGLTGISLCYREFYWRKETAGTTAQLNILDNVLARDQTLGIPDFGATAWYHFHTGCTGGPSGLSLTISGGNKNWTAAWPGVTMTFVADRGITVGQKDYIDYYNQFGSDYASKFPGIIDWPGIHKCVDIICPAGCTGLSLSTRVDITLFNPNPAPTPAPLLAATWRGLDSQISGQWDVQDIAGLSYVVPMVWLSYNDSFSVTPNLATSTIETPASIKTKITEAESQLGFSLTNKIFLAPRRYWYLDSFWGSTFDNIPTGLSYTDKNNAANQVFITPWADKGIEKSSQEWSAWLDGYKGSEGKLDFLVMDQENYGIPNYWWLTGQTTESDRRYNYLKGITSDPRFTTSWRGLTALSDLLSGISLNTIGNALNPAQGAFCTGCSLEYVKYNEAIDYYGQQTVNKGIWVPTTARYPNAKGSNYDGYIMTDRPAPDYNGHSQSRIGYFGTAASPALYGTNQLIGSTSSIWYVDRDDPTQVIYKKDGYVPPSGYTDNDRIPVGPNVWASFQLDLQLSRACKRSAPNLAFVPWIANYQFANPAIAGSEPTAKAAYWQNKKYYYEMIRHVSLIGAEGFLYWNTVDGASAAARIAGNYTLEIDDILREVNTKIGHRPVVTPVTLQPIPFTNVSNFNAARHSSKIVVSGAQLYSGKYLWRATTGETLAVGFKDIVSGATYGLSGDVGIWLETDIFSPPGLTTYYSP